MTGSFINILKQIYVNASVPVVIVSEDMKVLWKNSRAETAPDVPAADLIQSCMGEPSGLIRRNIGDAVYSFNVFKTEDPSEKNIYYIIETAETKKRTSPACDPDVRSFVNYLCSKIRIALGNITRTADDIFDSVSVGDINGEQITDGLNVIDRSIMSVAKEVVQPEHFYAMLDGCGTAVLSMADELLSIVGEMKSFLESSVSVTGDCPANIYFRMNRRIFQSVVAEMTAECCSSELYPDLIVYAVKRTDEDRAELTVRSINTSGNPNTAYDPAPREADVRGVNRHVFFDSVCSMLEERCGTLFCRQVQSDGILYKMDLEVFPKGSNPIAMKPAENFSGEPQRFGVISMSLADFYHSERYYYIDPVRIDDTTDYKK